MKIRRRNIAAVAVLVPMAALAGTATAADDLGTIDATFNAGGGGPDDKVYDMAFTSDGHIVIAGSFLNYNGEPAARIARLDADGNLDDAFNAAIGSGPDGYIESIDIDASGRIYAAGNFGNFDGEPREGLVRLGPDGSLDSAFTIGYFESSNFPGTKQRPRLVEENEGAVWVAGNWDGYDNGGGLDWTDTVVRFDGTGSSASDVIAGTIPLTFGFQPTTPVGMKVAPDGDLVVYGRFSTPRNGIYKVDPDGTPDGTFSFAPDVAENTGPNNTVTDVAFVDDTILAVGNFTSFHGDTSATGMVRLLADGSIDPTFDNPSASGMPDTTIAIDDDGNLYLVGVISDAFGGVGNFGRLLPDGQVDDTFPASIAASFPRVAAGPDGSVFLYRDLTAFGGEASARLLRIVTDSAPTVPGAPGSIRVVPDGANVIVSWSLPTDGATPEQYLAEAIPESAGFLQALPEGVAGSVVVPSCTVPHPQTTCTITGLAPATSYRIRVSSVIGGESVPSETTVGFFSGSGTPSPRPVPTPDGGVLPATGSGLALAVLAGGLLLAGTRLTRVARRSD